jgi:hypothetical protein
MFLPFTNLIAFYVDLRFEIVWHCHLSSAVKTTIFHILYECGKLASFQIWYIQFKKGS